MSSGPPYDAILFDCDSTLSTIEGIDELARNAGLYEQLSALTAAAMDGTLPLEAVYRRRLEAIQPTAQAMAALGATYIEHAVPGGKEAIATLQRCGKPVHIVSGGLRQALLPLAAFLGVPAHCVHAVDIFFDNDGKYLGFDDDSPLARSGGKSVICRQVQSLTGAAILLVGDGVTDSEVTAEGFDFVGFGGAVRREAVKRVASHYIEEPNLLPVLRYALTDRENAVADDVKNGGKD